MAIAGGATTAYRCMLSGKLLHTAPMGMIQRSQCVEPKQAVELLRRGETVTIAGSDVVKIEQMLESTE